VGQRRTEDGNGGKMARKLNHWGAPKKPNNSASFFFNKVHLFPKDLKVRTWRRQNWFLPRAPSNLGTSLLQRPTHS